MKREISCAFCGAGWHYQSFCPLKPKKPIKTNRLPKRISHREIEYQGWLRGVARPAVIKRDGEKCACWGCGSTTNLDLDHIKNKGGLYAGLKTDIGNLQLLCRYPCHYNKTHNKECLHDRNKNK